MQTEIPFGSGGFLCSACGKTKSGTPNHRCGLDDIYKYKEGEVIHDVLCYVCDECWPIKTKILRA